MRTRWGTKRKRKRRASSAACSPSMVSIVGSNISRFETCRSCPRLSVSAFEVRDAKPAGKGSYIAPYHGSRANMLRRSSIPQWTCREARLPLLQPRAPRCTTQAVRAATPPWLHTPPPPRWRTASAVQREQLPRYAFRNRHTPCGHELSAHKADPQGGQGHEKLRGLSSVQGQMRHDLGGGRRWRSP